MLAASGKSQHGWMEGAGCGQDDDSRFLRERYYDALGQVMDHSGLHWLKRREIYSKRLYSTPQSCVATHYLLSCHLDPRATEKQPSKADH